MKKQKQEKILDISDGDTVTNLSFQIYRMYESLRLIEKLEEIRRSEFQVDNWYDYNFIINDKIFEEPVSQKFDLDKSKIIQKNAKEVNQDNSLFDVITGDDIVTITVDMLGIKKEKINLRITIDNVEITTDNHEWEYHRLINLPCKVKPESTSFTYKNGILDITVSRDNRS